MNIFTVSFFGHRYVDNPIPVDKALEGVIGSLLRSKEYVEFLVGRNGDFDHLTSAAIRRCKRTIRGDNSSHIWVLPYLTAEYRDNEDAFRNYYDEIEICGNSSGRYFKGALRRRITRSPSKSSGMVMVRSKADSNSVAL